MRARTTGESWRELRSTRRVKKTTLSEKDLGDVPSDAISLPQTGPPGLPDAVDLAMKGVSRAEGKVCRRALPLQVTPQNWTGLE
jgi:hypothetical protein